MKYIQVIDGKVSGIIINDTPQISVDGVFLTDADFPAFNWYPVIEANSCDFEIQKITGFTGEVGDKNVTITYTLEDLDMPTRISNIKKAVTKVIDAKAQEFGFDNIISATTYIGDKNATFAALAQSLKDWRSDIWTTLEAGESTMTEIPLIADVINSLPPYVAPTN